MRSRSRVLFSNSFSIAHTFSLSVSFICIISSPYSLQFAGIITKEKASTVKDMPPYIPFLVYFWGSVACVFICGLILVLNAVLRVKKIDSKFTRLGEKTLSIAKLFNSLVIYFQYWWSLVSDQNASQLICSLVTCPWLLCCLWVFGVITMKIHLF